MEAEIGEDVLVAGVAKKPIFVPDFQDTECRLDTVLDSEANVDIKSRALVGGRPPVLIHENSSSLDDIQEEEIMEAAAVSEFYASPYSAPVDEDELIAAHVDRSLHLENFSDLLYQPNNSFVNNPHDHDTVEMSTSSCAFSSPKHSGNSAKLEGTIVPPPEFCSGDDDEVILRPAQVDRHNFSLDFCSDIPLVKVTHRPEPIIESDSQSEVEDVVEFSEASSAYCAPPGFDEPELVCEEQMTAFTVPKRSLDESILKNDQFQFVATPYHEPIYESDEEDLHDEKPVNKNEPVKIHVSHENSQPDVIVPQRMASTKYSAGMALKVTGPPSPTIRPETMNNRAPLSDAPSESSTDKSPKPKSKGFLSMFRRSPKSPRNDKSAVKNGEKSKSLPRNMTVSAAESGDTEKTSPNKSPNTPSKKSGFFSFGSRGKGKPNKSTTPDEPAPTNSPSGAKVSVNAKATPPSGKSNIRVFQIMAENDAAQHKEPENKQDIHNKEPEKLKGLESEPVVLMSVTRSVESAAPRAQDKERVASAPPVSKQVRASESSSGKTATSDPALPADFSISKYMVVVAIDFGTAFSGYAFSFTRDPESIHMMSRWEGGDPGIINQKIPSVLLLDPQGRFHSFGFTARNHYHDLSLEDSLQWLYFDKFKMSLYENSECSRKTTIEAANGQKFSAFEAVRMTLTFFKDHVLQELSEQCGTVIVNEDIRWIITVPAIWNSPAKQFMREAAYEAGFASSKEPDQLVIALEPEAASIHIRKLRLHQLVPDKPTATLPLSIRKLPQGPINQETVSSQFKAVTRYMVVDCGGGTVDITVHDISAVTGRLTEVYKASGGAHGSCGIDRSFEKLLRVIFGDEFIQSYQKNRPSGWVTLMLGFEARKRAASPFRVRQPLNVAFPFSFIDYHLKTKGVSVEKALSEYGDPDLRWSSQGMLRIAFEAMRKIFQETQKEIILRVKQVFDKVTGIQNIFLVGGLSESPIIQQAFRDEFGLQTRIVVPQEASLAVLKGAVCFGLHPGVVAERRSKLTYGAAVLHRFIPGKHPQSKLIHRDGVDWCKDVFDQFVEMNQIVRKDEPVVRSYTPASPNQPHINISIYSTEHTDVQFVTDPRVRQCATITLDLTTSGFRQTPSRRKILTFMSFAETEIKVTAIDTATDEKIDASIDFLSC